MTLLGTIARYRVAGTMAARHAAHPGTPAVFSAILAWYDTGHLDLPRHVPLATLRRELEYWQIPFTEETDLAPRDAGHQWLETTFPRVATEVHRAVDGWLASKDFRDQSARALEATWTVGPPRPTAAAAAGTQPDAPRSYWDLFATPSHRTLATEVFLTRGLETKWTLNVSRMRLAWPVPRHATGRYPFTCHEVTVRPTGLAHAAASFPGPNATS